MTRRDLLKILLASPAAFAIDYEKLLWIPKPIIVVPDFSLSNAVIAAWEQVIKIDMHLFDRDEYFFKTLEDRFEKHEIIFNKIISPLEIK